MTNKLLSVPEGREMIRAAGADIDPAKVPEQDQTPVIPAGQDETIQEDE